MMSDIIADSQVIVQFFRNGDALDGYSGIMNRAMDGL